MKKAKHLQRFWAFLLAFVLVSTTIASDGMSIVAAEGETTTEQTVSDPKQRNRHPIREDQLLRPRLNSRGKHLR